MIGVSRPWRVFALGAALALTLGSTAAARSVDVIARGLDNPRGLAMGADGSLYVTESGRGGSGPCVAGPEGGDRVCFGTTGAVTRVRPGGGDHARVVRGLPSLAAAGGAGAIGASDIAFSPRGDRAALTIGLGGDPKLRKQLGARAARMAGLYRFRTSGKLTRIADLGAFEAAKNPDAEQPSAEPDTNPNSVVMTARGRAVVADAGGNDLLAVDPKGASSLLAVFPFQTTTAPDVPNFPVPAGTQLPVQPVPTSVVRGPDGAYYVGELTGFPFVPGLARVWRIVPGSAPQMFLSGLTQVTDLAFGPDRSLYVLEYAKGPIAGPPSPGALIRIRRDGTRQELAAGALRAATGLTISGGNAYVSNRGDQAGKGEVVRISLANKG